MIDAIAAVKKHGGIRAAAREHGIPYSTFQYMYHNQGGEPLRFNVTNIIDRRYAKILIFDLEVSPVDILHRTYGLKNQTRYYSPDQILHDYSLLSAAWKWYGEDKVSCISVSPVNVRNDYYIVQKIAEMINNADIVVGHNLDSFDMKKLSARLAIHGEAPIKRVRTVDTLKLARKKFAFTSNKLSYLAEILKVSSKDESPDWGLVMSGCRDELSKCREYNRRDVVVTEQVFDKLYPFSDSYVDLNLFHGLPVYMCPKCGSHNTQRNGNNYTQVRKVQQYRCLDCMTSFSETTLMRSKMNVKRL